MLKLLFLISLLPLRYRSEAARILAVFPVPLISHQGPIRAIIHELVYRDHEVVTITPLPEYKKGDSPENLMEIDVSNVTKEEWDNRYDPDITDINNDLKGDFLQIMAKVVEKQFQIPEVKNFIRNNETFDLLLLDAWIRPLLVWTYVYDVPVVAISSFGPSLNDYINLAGSIHPILYPTNPQYEVGDKTTWQKLTALYEYWKLNSMYKLYEKEENEVVKRLFGEVPPLRDQLKKIELLLLNIHQVWQGVRPVPMNVIHLAGTQLQDRERKTEMTEELKQYLDARAQGIVYVNFGNITRPRMFSNHMQRKLIQAFGKLKSSVLWRWDNTSAPHFKDLPPNMRIGPWFPQAELLKHPNVRLFISQCEQQSVDEAIDAAVPLLAIPMVASQQGNAAQLLRHKIGNVLHLENTNVDELSNVIELTMKNDSYRTNIQRLRTLIFDAPAPAPVRAANAIEYVLRHTSRHIADPTLHIQWYQYMELELLLTVLIYLYVSILVLGAILYKLSYWIIGKVVKRFTARKSRKNSFMSVPDVW